MANYMVFPDGMIGHAFGSLGAKRNDLNDLHDSNINNMMMHDVQLGNDFQYKIFGNGIYPHLAHAHSKIRSDVDLTALEHIKNNGHSSVWRMLNGYKKWNSWNGY
jgi:hypothetical protein